MTRILMVLALLAATTAARADEKEDPRALYDQGVVAYGLGRYDKAAELYERAFALKPDAALLYNAAQSHRLAGNKKRALMLYQNFLRLFPTRTNRGDVARLIDDLKHSIAQDERTATSPPTDTMSAQLPPKATPTPTPAPAASNSVVASAPDRRPIYRKPWFWGAVVGGAVVVGLAVGLGVGLGVKNDPTPTWGPSVKF